MTPPIRSQLFLMGGLTFPCLDGYDQVKKLLEEAVGRDRDNYADDDGDPIERMAGRIEVNVLDPSHRSVRCYVAHGAVIHICEILPTVDRPPPPAPEPEPPAPGRFSTTGAIKREQTARALEPGEPVTREDIEPMRDDADRPPRPGPRPGPDDGQTFG